MAAQQKTHLKSHNKFHNFDYAFCGAKRIPASRLFRRPEKITCKTCRQRAERNRRVI